MSNASSSTKPSAKAPAGPVAPALPGAESSAPVVSWNPVLVILIVLLLFLIPQIIAGVVIGAASQGGLSFLRDSVYEQFSFVFLAEALTLIGLYLVLRTRKQNFKSLGLTKLKLSDPMYAVIGYVAYFALNIVLVTILSRVIPGLDINQKQDTGFDTAKSALSLVPVFIALVILAPLAEEVLVRGFLFVNLRRYLPLIWAIITTSVIFGSAHLFGGEPGAPLLWIAAIDTFALSVVLCYLREKTGRLWAGIGLHALKNFIAFMALFVLHLSS